MILTVKVMLIMDEEYLSINAVLGLDGVDRYDDIAIICFIMIGELTLCT